MSRLLLLPIVLLSIAACQTRQKVAGPERDLKEEERLHKAGLVLVPDLEHASAWEKLIHVDMGVPQRKIEVQPGPGYTTVTIKDLKNRADAESVAREFRDIAAKQPEKFGPTKVLVSMENTTPTINPFVLPNEVGAPAFNPGESLPTLSLPPLQPAAR